MTYETTNNFAGPQQSEDPTNQLVAIVAHASMYTAMWLIAPLVVWFVYKDKNRFVREHAAQAFDMQLWTLIGGAIIFLLAVTVIGLPVAIVLAVIIGAYGLIAPAFGCYAAYKGRDFSYPAMPGLLSQG